MLPLVDNLIFVPFKEVTQSAASCEDNRIDLQNTPHKTTTQKQISKHINPGRDIMILCKLCLNVSIWYLRITSLRYRVFSLFVKDCENHFVSLVLPCLLIKNKQWIILCMCGWVGLFFFQNLIAFDVLLLIFPNNFLVFFLSFELP